MHTDVYCVVCGTVGYAESKVAQSAVFLSVYLCVCLRLCQSSEGWVSCWRTPHWSAVKGKYLLHFSLCEQTCSEVTLALTLHHKPVTLIELQDGRTFTHAPSQTNTWTQVSQRSISKQKWNLLINKAKRTKKGYEKRFFKKMKKRSFLQSSLHNIMPSYNTLKNHPA